ncbi:zinc-binding dehydrogenase [Nonomuraea fuscirosea]|uniref:zinc-binding dehydrogenase n=1 Tax=Nonomuraea fuscirosea TaxID=1291556 RepID=UPI000D058885|nr:zinc-binding dehydrogenase [Nonomuraea fuscirosea]
MRTPDSTRVRSRPRRRRPRLAGHGALSETSLTGPRRAGHRDRACRLRTGALALVIGRTFDLSDIAEAHRYLEANGRTGKIIVTVQR